MDIMQLQQEKAEKLEQQLRRDGHVCIQTKETCKKKFL